MVAEHSGGGNRLMTPQFVVVLAGGTAILTRKLRPGMQRMRPVGSHAPYCDYIMTALLCPNISSLRAAKAGHRGLAKKVTMYQDERVIQVIKRLFAKLSTTPKPHS